MLKKLKTALTIGLGSIIMLSSSPKQVSANENAFHFTAMNGALQGLVAGVNGYRNGCGFLESAFKGFIGGSLNGMGKACVGDDLNYAWPAKIMNAFGTSIVNDAGNCDELGTSFTINYGPAVFEWRNDRKDKFNWYILPDSLMAGFALAGNGHKLDLEDSIKYGVPFFYSKDSSPKQHDGEVYANNVFINKEREGPKLKNHEFIHTLQYFSLYPFGNLILNTSNYTKNFDNDLKNYHLDISPWVGSSLIGLDNLSHSYKNRFMEQEAYGLTK